MNELINHSSPTAFPFPPNASVTICFVDYAKHAPLFKWDLPQIQRELDTAHADKLRRRFVETYDATGAFDFGLFELVSLHDKLFLVNGQHRYYVLQRLLEEGYPELPLHIRIKRVDSQKQMEVYFCEVNGSKPALICSSPDEQLIVNGFKKHMVATYGRNYFPHTKRPHKPNLNLDVVVEYFIQIQLIEKLGFKHCESLCAAVDKLNRFYSSKMYKQSWWDQQQIRADANRWKAKVVDKNPTDPLFLGIYPNYEWIDRMIVHVRDGTPYKSMPHFWKNVHCRKKPSQQLKNAIWKKRNAAGVEGTCYVCNDPLLYWNSQCGHIISYYHGGQTQLSNMEPLCGSCNRDMGIENMRAYRERRRALI